MTIRKRLLYALAALGFSVVAIAGALIFTSWHGATALETILTDRVEPLRDLKVVADKYAVDIVDASHKARNGNYTMAQSAEQVRQGSAKLHERWAVYTSTYLTPEERVLVGEAKLRMAAADEAVGRLQAILERGDRPALDRFVVTELYSKIDPVSESVGKLVDLQIEQAHVEASNALAASRTAGWISALLLAGALAALVAAIRTTLGRVVRPIDALSGVMDRLAKDEIDIDVPFTKQPDEVGTMSRAVEVFRQAAVRKREADAERIEVVNTLGEAIAGLAQGNLADDIEARFPAEYAKLRDDFNAAVDRLRTTIATVAERVEAVRSASTEIENASGDLANRTEQQAASLEETAASVEELSQTARATAGNVSQVSHGAESTRGAAEAGAGVVREAAAAMTRISASSREIGNIVSLIDEIAFQTNLLALNAGVEAARAGDAGRGFAVVANEVRSLAQRSAEAAKDIKSIVQKATEQVEDGVELVGRSGEALDTILAEAMTVSGLASEIAAAVEQQSVGVNQISSAVSAMDKATQQNAAMVEESNAACVSLAREAQELEQAIAFFDTGSPRRTARPARGARQLQAVGNAALKSDDDWNSF